MILCLRELEIQRAGRQFFDLLSCEIAKFCRCWKEEEEGSNAGRRERIAKPSVSVGHKDAGAFQYINVIYVPSTCINWFLHHAPFSPCVLHQHSVENKSIFAFFSVVKYTNFLLISMLTSTDFRLYEKSLPQLARHFYHFYIKLTNNLTFLLSWVFECSI